MGYPGLLCCDQLSVAYNYHILTQKHTAVAINRGKLSQAPTGDIGFKVSGLNVVKIPGT